MKRDDLSSQVDSRKVRRRPYVKPRVEKVQLLPEEAVLGAACKTETGAGGVQIEGGCVPTFQCYSDIGS